MATEQKGRKHHHEQTDGVQMKLLTEGCHPETLQPGKHADLVQVLLHAWCYSEPSSK